MSMEPSQKDPAIAMMQMLARKLNVSKGRITKKQIDSIEYYEFSNAKLAALLGYAGQTLIKATTVRKRLLQITPAKIAQRLTPTTHAGKTRWGTTLFITGILALIGAITLIYATSFLSTLYAPSILKPGLWRFAGILTAGTLLGDLVGTWLIHWMPTSLIAVLVVLLPTIALSNEAMTNTLSNLWKSIVQNHLSFTEIEAGRLLIAHLCIGLLIGIVLQCLKRYDNAQLHQGAAIETSVTQLLQDARFLACKQQLQNVSAHEHEQYIRAKPFEATLPPVLPRPHWAPLLYPGMIMHQVKRSTHAHTAPAVLSRSSRAPLPAAALAQQQALAPSTGTLYSAVDSAP